MKAKIITAILILAFSLNLVCFADYKLGNPENEIILSGESSPYESISVMLLNSDNLSCTDAKTTKAEYEKRIKENTKLNQNEIFFFATVRCDKDGKWSLTVPVNSNTETVNLTFLTNAGDLEYIKYGSSTYRMSKVSSLKQNANINDDATTLSNDILVNIDYISDMPELYNLLDNKKQVALMNKDAILNLPDDYTALDKLKEGIDTAIVIEAVNEGKISDFNLAKSIVSYNTDIENNITETGKNAVVSTLKGGNYNNISMYQSAFETALYLQGFYYNKNMSGENLSSYLSLYGGYLSPLDLSGFNSLESSYKAYVALELSKVKCSDILTMQQKLNSIIVTPPPVILPSGNGGGGGGGAAPTVTSGEASVSNDYIEGQKYVYSDLKGSEWALDAISYLAKEGIISGYENGQFKPLNSVTRAEFTKMIVETFYKYSKVDNSDMFNDVSKDMWYADYINTAYSKGIIKGIENNNFGPDNNITRQDMAVIILNVAKEFNIISLDNTVNSAFSDDSFISDYAKEAVYILKNAGVINGVGNGNFAPNDTLNRASAAQIIYNLIKSYKEV